MSAERELPPQGRKNPGPPKGRKNPNLSRRLQHAGFVWRERGHRDRFVSSVNALGGLPALPLIVGGTQRGVVRSWIDDTAPTPRTLRRTLAGLIGLAAAARELDHERRRLLERDLDPEAYSTYLLAWPRAKLILTECPGPNCPRKGEVRRVESTAIEAAVRRRGKKFTHLANGHLARWCRPCSARRQLDRIASRGAQRGGTRGRRWTWGRDAKRVKSPDTREAIAQRHTAMGRLSKQFRLCSLCGFFVYGHDWHRGCWLTWKRYCESTGMNPSTERPELLRQRGPNPEGFVMRNYQTLIAHRLRRETRGKILEQSSRWRPAGRRGRTRRLASTRSVNNRITALVRLAPGTWEQGFTKKDAGNAERQRALPLPEALAKMVGSGARDPIIRRLYGYGMSPSKIAHLTGAPLERVQKIIGDVPRPQIALPSWHRSRVRKPALAARREELLGWIREGISTDQMLKRAQQDPHAPYRGGMSTFYKYIARLRKGLKTGADQQEQPDREQVARHQERG